MMNEKILTKIRNLFDLANNNPNENEALAAALKAQELMAKYGVSAAQLDDNKVDKNMIHAMYTNTEKHEMKKWKIALCQVIASNFRCRVYCKGTAIVFYGYESDANVALETFKFLYNTGNKLAVKYYNQKKKAGLSTKGVMNAYLMGFVKGIKEALDKQCTALMIVIPKEVNESYEKMSANWGTKKNNVNCANDTEAYNQGKKDGKEAMSTKQLAG